MAKAQREQEQEESQVLVGKVLETNGLVRILSDAPLAASTPAR